MSSDLSYLMSLDVPNKLELIGVLWDSIDAQGEVVPVSESLIAELDRRKAAVTQQPETLIPLAQVLQRLGRDHAA